MRSGVQEDEEMSEDQRVILALPHTWTEVTHLQVLEKTPCVRGMILEHAQDKSVQRHVLLRAEKARADAPTASQLERLRIAWMAIGEDMAAFDANLKLPKGSTARLDIKECDKLTPVRHLMNNFHSMDRRASQTLNEAATDHTQNLRTGSTVDEVMTTLGAEAYGVYRLHGVMATHSFHAQFDQCKALAARLHKEQGELPGWRRTEDRLRQREIKEPGFPKLWQRTALQGDNAELRKEYWESPDSALHAAAYDKLRDEEDKRVASRERRIQLSLQAKWANLENAPGAAVNSQEVCGNPGCTNKLAPQRFYTYETELGCAAGGSDDDFVPMSPVCSEKCFRKQQCLLYNKALVAHCQKLNRLIAKAWTFAASAGEMVAARTAMGQLYETMDEFRGPVLRRPVCGVDARHEKCNRDRCSYVHPSEEPGHGVHAGMGMLAIDARHRPLSIPEELCVPQKHKVEKAADDRKEPGRRNTTGRAQSSDGGGRPGAKASWSGTAARAASSSWGRPQQPAATAPQGQDGRGRSKDGRWGANSGWSWGSR